jgi:hypothetical protein
MTAPRQSLATLRRLRMIAVEQARRALAEAAAATAGAEAAVAARRAALAEEARLAAAHPGLAESHARWRPRGLAAIAEAERALQAAEQRRADSQAALTEARTAAESLGTYLDAQVQLETIRQEQRAGQALLDTILAPRPSLCLKSPTTQRRR